MGIDNGPTTASPIKSDALALESNAGSPASARLRSSRKSLHASMSMGSSVGSSVSSSCSSSSSSSGRSPDRDIDASTTDLVENGLASHREKGLGPGAGGVAGGKGSPGHGQGHHQHHMLGEWTATALCGNDVMSSCLYTIGLVTQSAGKLSPLAFVMVSVVLYLIKAVYAMAVLPFPHNGGSYNVLANVAPRPVAALGASLSIISYIATCVVSAVSACDYLAKIVPVNPLLAAILLLVAFAALTLCGMRESATIAFAIWIVHILTLAVLALGCLAYAASEGFGILLLNKDEPLPALRMADTDVSASVAASLFLGFSSAMLGVSGYETTAQCIENMQTPTFLRVLRNLWLGSSLINPTLAFLAISVLPIAEISANSDTVLAKMALTWGDWAFGEGSRLSQLMADWMSIDAFIVLSGAVLTAFIGVDGLIYQMAQDRCLPQILLRKNKWRKTNHVIILSFLLLSLALVVIMRGRVFSLAGVYSLAFLGVLATFIIGAMLLKTSPKHAPALAQRGLMLPWRHLLLALALVAASLLGNLLGPASIAIFLAYLVPIFAVCLACMYADRAKAHCCPTAALRLFGPGASPVPPSGGNSASTSTSTSPDVGGAAGGGSRNRTRTSPTAVSLGGLDGMTSGSGSAPTSASSSPTLWGGIWAGLRGKAAGLPPLPPQGLEMGGSGRVVVAAGGAAVGGGREG